LKIPLVELLNLCLLVGGNPLNEVLGGYFNL